MFEMILGHFVGDYLLQSKWMAFGKGSKDIWGWYYCFVHCLVYTLSVCFMMKNYNPYWMLLVFVSHFVIDKFSLGEYWLKLIDGRSLTVFLKEYQDLKINAVAAIQAGFGTLVYAVVDNTLHILIMYYGYKLMF